MSSPVGFPRWYLALAPRAAAVVRCYLPGAPVDPRRRELVGTVVSVAAGSDALAAVHADWHHVLGPAELDELDDDVLAWVAAAVGPVPHLDGADLPDSVDDATRRALAALVAHGVVAAATLDRAGSLVSRLLGRSPRSVPAAVGDLASVVAGAPFTVGPAVAGVAVGLLGRLAPPPAAVEVGAEPNLLVQLLVETLPTWLGSAWGRTLVGRLPFVVPVGVRSGATTATVRIGQGLVRVDNGIAADIWALVDGDVDALVRAGSLSLTRELRAARPRR